jgi:HPt (histidine-containing phosphotransfer) domain-containing protein
MAPKPVAEKPAITGGLYLGSADASSQHQALFSAETLGSLKSSLGAKEMSDIIKDLYDKTESLIGAAENAAKSKDKSMLTSCSHDLMGMAANFGLMALSDIAKQINRRARDGETVEDLAPVVTQLRPAYTDTRKVVDAWIKK